MIVTDIFEYNPLYSKYDPKSMLIFLHNNDKNVCFGQDWPEDILSEIFTEFVKLLFIAAIKIS